MKLVGVSFVLFAVIVFWATSFLSKSVHQSVAAQGPVLVCTGQKTCSKSPLSVYAPTPTPVPGVGTIPASGYCLLVPVLLYHHVESQADAAAKGQTSLNVDSTIFDSQMAYIVSRGYTTISAEQLVNAITTHSSLPGKPIVLTFDDGYLDNYTYAFPVLQKYHLIGNLMVPTGLLGVQSGTNSYYSWDQLKQMVGSGSMFVYNHTWSHYPLAQGPADKDTHEMTLAQQQLQQNFGKTSPIFVYPYGSGQTLRWVQQLVKADGFVAAFSTLPGVYQCEGNIMELPRLHIGNAPLGSYGL